MSRKTKPAIISPVIREILEASCRTAARMPSEGDLMPEVGDDFNGLDDEEMPSIARNRGADLDFGDHR